ncbi:MAG TPA: hypothetical protein VGF55_09105 [Gemmataceae bacterium]|jgi:hypothetical protein
MFRHRLAPEADYYRLPAPPAPTIRPASFVLCPLDVTGVTADPWALQIYVLAFEQAATVVRPALPDRGLFAFWN